MDGAGEKERGNMRFCVWRIWRLAFANKGVIRNLGWKRLFWRLFWLDARFWNERSMDTEYVRRLLRQFVEDSSADKQEKGE
jgi:hypothetical protein